MTAGRDAFNAVFEIDGFYFWSGQIKVFTCSEDFLH